MSLSCASIGSDAFDPTCLQSDSGGPAPPVGASNDMITTTLAIIFSVCGVLLIGCFINSFFFKRKQRKDAVEAAIANQRRIRAECAAYEARAAARERNRSDATLPLYTEVDERGVMPPAYQSIGSSSSRDRHSIDEERMAWREERGNRGSRGEVVIEIQRLERVVLR